METWAVSWIHQMIENLDFLSSKLQIVESGDPEIDSLLKQIAPVSGAPKVSLLLLNVTEPCNH
jgi:hypothetical protein